ncbi:MAG: hypothetical protein Ta2D_10210 [Rickettsiales bacterium]|nr:MAG: hypothetical protein Ta2D_10210 [Rickettsiales bacterium]
MVELQNILDNFNKIDNSNLTMSMFINSSLYAICYAIAQRFVEIQNMASGIYDYYESYVKKVNEKISQPLTTNNGIIDYFNRNGYMFYAKEIINPVEDYNVITTALNNLINSGTEINVSIAQSMLNSLDNIKNSAGNNYFCIAKIDGSENDNQEIANLINNCCDVSNIFYGDKSGSVILNNNQQITYKWVEPIKELLNWRITLTLSKNYSGNYLNDNQIKDLFKENLKKYCKLGNNIEPDRLLEIDRDGLNYCADILVEWKNDDASTQFTNSIKYNDYNILEAIENDEKIIIQWSE